MSRIVLAFVLMLMTYNVSRAQYELATDRCVSGRINTHKTAAKNTVAAPEEENYDVHFVQMNLFVDNESVNITGEVSTTASVLDDNFGLYVFELNKLLDISLVNINGQQAQFTREGDVVKVLMPKVLHTDSIFTAQVFYNGAPEGGTVFFFQSGLNNAPSERWNSKVTYTLSEPYASKDWWPCKQSLQDKIDSAIISITVPDSLMAGSNGLLIGTDNPVAGKIRYTWKTTYPTAYYLFSIAVADYRDYSYNTKLPDGTDLLVQNFIYDRDSILLVYQEGIDTTGMMLQYFSELFGTYPFHKEKYGHCMAPVFGGMEHQTMTTLHDFDAPLVSHELAHQWFGDYVTCATWKDIWLNEGFASYCEYLFAEKFWTANSSRAYLDKIHAAVIEDTNAGGRTYVPATDTVNPYRIFDGRLSYLKPAAVLHTLRYVIDNDDIFFQALRTYLDKYAFSNANTEQFIAVAEQVSGMNLRTFFNEWIYGEGYPVYDLHWNQTGNTISVQLQQKTTVPATVPYFTTPVELKFITNTGDTTIKVTPTGIQDFFTLNISQEVLSVIVDPNQKILNKATTYRDLRIGINLPADGDIIVYPNPTNNYWSVANINAGTQLALTTLDGKIVWKQTTDTDYGVVIPANNFPRGIYILHAVFGDKQLTSKKLVRY